MNETLAIALLWLFVINLGIAVGAGFYELRVVVPAWGSAPPQSLRSPESGLSFWIYVTTGPLTLLTLLSLIAVWWTTEPGRTWWLVAAVVVALERVATLGYFVPTMMRLQRDQAARADAARAAFQRWSGLNIARNIASLVACLAALKALALVG
jgi:hypothetical protein